MELTPSLRSSLLWITLGRRPWTDRERWDNTVGPVNASALRALQIVEDWTHRKDGKPFASPKVTLSAYGALLMDVEVVNLRWTKANRPEGRNKITSAPGIASFPDLEWVVDPKSLGKQGPEIKIDPWTGVPLKIMGMEVPIDWRLGARKAG